MTITDDQLTRALAAAADSFDVPEWEGLESPVRAPLWQRRSLRWTAGAAAGLAAIVALGAISSSAPRSADSSATGAPTGMAEGTVPLDAGADQSSSQFSLSGQPGATNFSGSAQPGRAPAGGTTGVVAPAAPATPSRVVKTGSISLVVDDGKVPATMLKLRQVAGSAGGFLSEEKTQGVGSDPSGTATIRVPVARFDAVVAQISGKGFGAKVTSVQSAGKDITSEYADTEAQIKSLKAAHSRYLTILNGADSIGEILSVQQRVDQVQGQIDRLEGNRRLQQSQSDLATLQVDVNQKTAQVLSTERSGWSKAWHDATHGFTGGIQALVAHSGTALLVLLVGIACIVLGRTGWRIARRRLI